MTSIIPVKNAMIAKSVLLSLAACSLLATAQGESAVLAEVREKCREEFNLTMEQVEHLNMTRRLETNDENIKCFVKCLLIELKVMDGEGVFTSDETIINMLKNKKHYPICSGVSGTDLCDKAVNFQNCFWKQMKMDEANID